MTHQQVKCLATAAASIALLLVAGCHDDTHTVPANPTAAETVKFSTFANQAFSNSANSTPVAVNGINFTFDVDDQPSYFSQLIAMGTYQ